MLFEKAIRNGFSNALSRMTEGAMRVHFPDGDVTLFGAPDTPEERVATLVIHDNAALAALAAKGDVGFAESYRLGLWDSDDPALLIETALRNEHCMSPYIYGRVLARALAAFSYIANANTLKGSRKNISAHYDLGNAFYREWLDSTMTYSSALYLNDNMSLEEAQNAKYDRLIDGLSSDTGALLEIGCGWGGFAERAAERGDFAVKGITLSEEQYRFASARNAPGHVTALEDYRAQTGKYDHIVSIEMFEAVGERYWPAYFGKIRDLLKPGGRAAIQTITIAEPYFKKYKKSGDAIRSFIFPGGMLPTESAFAASAASKGLKTENTCRFGKDYAKTLDIWRERFDAALPALTPMGYDNAFARMWRFYLCASSAGFRTGRVNVMQTELCHAA